MKIAAVTNDGTDLSAHFGRAAAYLVVTTEGDRIVAEELRDKPAHHGHHGHGACHAHGQGPGHGHEHGHDHEHGAGEGQSARHAEMVEPIRDCRVVLARGMGRRAHDALVEAGLEPILVKEHGITDAIRAYLDGTLESRPELLH